MVLLISEIKLIILYCNISMSEIITKRKYIIRHQLTMPPITLRFGVKSPAPMNATRLYTGI